MKVVFDILKGILIGVANIVPGVSGGTMMVSMGIYDDIISSITNLFRQFKKSVLTLLPYGIGMGIGIVGFAFIIQYLFANFPIPTAFLFIGLILGGLPIMLGKIKGKKINAANGLVFFLFFALVIGLQILGEGNGTDTTITLSIVEIIKLFFIGVITSSTMVIPGVSGSMILMLIGYYNPILNMVTEVITALTTMDMPVLLHGIGILIPFGIGVIIGIFAIAKIIELLLQHYETLTFSGILGLVCASPIAVLMNTDLSEFGIISILISIVTFFIGCGISYFLGRE